MTCCLRPGALLARFALALGAATGVDAQATRIPPIPIDTFTMENGLHVIVSPDHSTPVVAVSVWYGVGSAHEQEGQAGFAHLFEHMLYGATEHLAEGESMRLVARAGGRLTGNTTLDRTAFLEVLPANRVNLALWLHAERMGGLVLSEEGLETQRAVIEQERRQRADGQPYAQAQLLQDTLSQSWAPYRRVVIGSMEDLEGADISDVRAFHQRYHGPGNASLAVVGDVDVGQVRELVATYFGGVPAGGRPPTLAPPPEMPRSDGERRAEVTDPLAQLPLLSVGYGIPPAQHPDQAALAVLMQVLSTGENSRLRQRLVHRDEMALAFFVNAAARVGPGSLVFAAVPEGGHGVEALESAMRDEIEGVRGEGITQVELERARNQLRAQAAAARSTAQGKATLLQQARLLHGSAFEVNRSADRMEAVTRDDVRRVARDYLVPENRTVVIARPRRSGAP